MAAAAAPASWIARQWKRGWQKIPLIMAAQCIIAPLWILVIIPKITLPRGNWYRDMIFPVRPTAKYRASYTVIRSDDRRAGNISHTSKIDYTGVFS